MSYGIWLISGSNFQFIYLKITALISFNIYYYTEARSTYRNKFLGECSIFHNLHFLSDQILKGRVPVAEVAFIEGLIKSGRKLSCHTACKAIRSAPGTSCNCIPVMGISSAECTGTFWSTPCKRYSIACLNFGFSISLASSLRQFRVTWNFVSAEFLLA